MLSIFSTAQANSSAGGSPPGAARGYADSTLELTPEAAKEIWLNYLLQAAYADDKTKIELFDRMVKFLVRYHLSPSTHEKVADAKDLAHFDIHQHFETLPLQSRISWVEEYKHLRRAHLEFDDRELEAKEQERFRKSNLNLLFLLAAKEAAVFFAKSAADPSLFFQNLMTDINELKTDRLKLMFINRFEEAFSEAISRMDSIGEVIATSPEIDIEHKGMRALLKIAVGNYFKLLNLNSKKSIVSSLLSLPPDASPLDVFPILIANSGPQFQKMIQLLAREEGLSPRIAEMFQKLEKDAHPIAWPLVEKVIASNEYPFEWVKIETVPFSVGTMAQAHRGVIRMNGYLMDVVVRVLKPGIEDKVAQDGRILQEIAPLIDQEPEVRGNGLPAFTPITEELTQSVIIELDLDGTTDRQLIAERVYLRSFKLDAGEFQGKLNIRVPKAIPTPGAKGVSVQALVKGESFEKVMDALANEPPLLRRRIVETIAKMWWNEVLFNEGFFHADLHRGNFLVRHEGNEISIEIVDYGMGGVLSPRVRSLLVLTSSAIQILSANGMSEGLWALRNPESTRIDKTEFKRRVQDETAKVRSGESKEKEFDAWVSWATEQGVGFSFEFVNLNRGAKMINGMLKKTGSAFDVMRMSRTVARQRVLRVTWDILRSGYFTPAELMKLSWNLLHDMREERKVRKNEKAMLREIKNTAQGSGAKSSASDTVRCEALFAPR